MLEKRERERTGISSLKVRYNKVFGYYIEVTKANLPQVPPDYIRKQTLVGSERFLTPELKEYEEKVLHAEERIGELEAQAVCRGPGSGRAGRRRGCRRSPSDVALLDVLAGLAELASRRNYVRPEVNDGRCDQDPGRPASRHRGDPTTSRSSPTTRTSTGRATRS